MSYRQQVVMLKGPGGARAWLIAQDEGNSFGASTVFAQPVPGLSEEASLRYALGIPDAAPLPVQIEVEVSKKTMDKLRGQGLWR